MRSAAYQAAASGLLELIEISLFLPQREAMKKMKKTKHVKFNFDSI
jgi:hypothetical protein